MDLRFLQRQKSCQACMHSVAHSEGLWCTYWDRETNGLCDAYHQAEAELSDALTIKGESNE